MAKGVDAKELKDAIEEFRSESREARKSGNRTSVVLGIIAAVALLGVPVISVLLPPAAQPPTYSCIESYDKAIEMYEDHGVWVPLPENSPEEQQCEINDRMVDLYDLPPTEPGSGGGSSGGGF